MRHIVITKVINLKTAPLKITKNSAFLQMTTKTLRYYEKIDNVSPDTITMTEINNH